MFFRTYLYPQLYDFFVKGVSARFSLNRTKFKIAFDVCSLLVAVGLTLLFFRRMPISYYMIGAVLQAIFVLGIRFSYKFFLSFSMNRILEFLIYFIMIPVVRQYHFVFPLSQTGI